MTILDPDEHIQKKEKEILAFTRYYDEHMPHLSERDETRYSAFGIPSVLRGMRDHTRTVATIEVFQERAIKLGEYPVRNALFRMGGDLLRAEYYYEIEDFYKSNEIIKQVMTKAEAGGFTHQQAVFLPALPPYHVCARPPIHRQLQRGKADSGQS